MKTFTTLLSLLFMQLILVQTAVAEDSRTALVPLPSVDDFSNGEDGWSFGLGLGVEYETAYEGSDEFGVEIQPAGAVQWRSGDNVFFFAGEALGWRGLRSDTWLLEALVGFDEGREESDSDDGRLDGLGDTEEGFQLVFQARRALDADWRYWLVGRAVATENGNLGLFGVGRRFGDKNDGSGSEINAVVVFHDSEYANTGFGVTAEQSAASGLNQTSMGGGLRSFGLDYNYRYFVNNNWQIFAEALYEYFSSDVRNSPIARSNYEAEIGIGFIYVF
ncbi:MULTISPECIES: MipA/OmpV family protein [unclassified Arsukibacterium]|uniref:MipA/OmpV family protein n=1 Tax=unclassified Arsukibacterium TaxID=2635278 RepID=UPI000C5C0F16|nr:MULTISPECIES: MipA/OmpV family protein [unclassified Arsukibacterium]MAA93181.1 structural protein MipA [Rheinheimera sp.]MBM35187.1 structural protein MipA [Rheinheimera sp.]HAW94097.1 MipA/OmpV family protein [Candidatus Azambacteria bacterium]|tara:strand:- start:25370 stop:26197 length:828 start_codon:yes stop_codon:yes gene_type:complete